MRRSFGLLLALCSLALGACGGGSAASAPDAVTVTDSVTDSVSDSVTDSVTDSVSDSATDSVSVPGSDTDSVTAPDPDSAADPDTPLGPTTPLLDFDGEAEQGDGRADAPFVVTAPGNLLFSVQTMSEGEVAADPGTTWDIDRAELPAPVAYGDRARLTLPEGFTGSFRIGALRNGLMSLPTYLYFDVGAAQGDNEAPVARLSADPARGRAPLEVHCDASLSSDPNGDTLTFSWDFDGDGTWDAESGTDPSAIHTYTEVGQFIAKVRATDPDGLTGEAPYPVDVESGDAAWQTLAPALREAGASSGYDTRLRAVGGRPAIAFSERTSASDGDRFRPAFVRAADALGSTWGAPVVIEEGEDGTSLGSQIDLLVIDGRPAVCFAGRPVDDGGHGWWLFYERAADDAGSDWSAAALVLDDSGDVGSCSLALVDGFPAMSYTDADGNRLRYVRALDARGDSWGAAVTVHAGVEPAETGRDSSLAVVDGHPAIAWREEHGGFEADKLYFARAGTTTGLLAADWPGPLEIASASGTGRENALLVSEGLPRIGCRRGDQLLEFFTAADAQGASWGRGWGASSESGSEYIGWATSAVVGDRLAMAYVTATMTDGRLRYVFAGDETGESWEHAEDVDTVGWTLGVPSLCEIGGCAAISYQGEGEDGLGELRYAILRSALSSNSALLRESLP